MSGNDPVPAETKDFAAMLVSDIPTETFNAILADLSREGWETVLEYDGIDAWIDYGNVVLVKDSLRLIFEWNNWFEGSIEGVEAVVKPLKSRYGLE